MRITIYGAGYVGLVTGTCFAELGNDVLVVDIDAQRIASLKAGVCPIHEPGLPEMIRACTEAGRLQFSTDYIAGVNHGLYQFIAVGTPQGTSGAADLSAVMSVAQTLGQHLNDYRLVITKSTVPVGTCDKVEHIILRELEKRHCRSEFDIASNPEFLREGAAIDDFMNSDRIIVGTKSPRAAAHCQALYAPFNRNHDRLIAMDIRSAELTKYAANAMLATKISFINEMSNLAERLHADIDQVRIGIGADPRIGHHFINPGPGFGGSCFPKDIYALESMAHEVGLPVALINAVRTVNDKQKRVLFNKIEKYFRGDLTNKTIAIWGLAFKPNTDDMREASSLTLLQDLWAAGARANVFDPVAMPSAQKIFGSRDDIQYCQSPEDTLGGADALVVLTEWNIFYSPDFQLIKAQLNHPVIFDGRNLYDPQYLSQMGIEYYGIGRGLSCYENT